MSPETSGDKSGVQALIKKLGTSENPFGPMLAESLIELYESNKFSSAWFDSEISLREYETRTSPVAWRFIIAGEEDLLIAPVLNIAAPEKIDGIIPFMKEATQNLKEPKGETKQFVEKVVPIAVDAAIGIGLRTLAVMQLNEHHTTGRYITEIAYPRIYREIIQLDVWAATAGVDIGPFAKESLGVSLGINLLKQVPFHPIPDHISGDL
jgi:hypothetical protein